jgi:hypothetical protein
MHGLPSWDAPETARIDLGRPRRTRANRRTPFATTGNAKEAVTRTVGALEFTDYVPSDGIIGCSDFGKYKHYLESWFLQLRLHINMRRRLNSFSLYCCHRLFYRSLAPSLHHQMFLLTSSLLDILKFHDKRLSELNSDKLILSFLRAKNA